MHGLLGLRDILTHKKKVFANDWKPDGDGDELAERPVTKINDVHITDDPEAVGVDNHSQYEDQFNNNGKCRKEAPKPETPFRCSKALQPVVDLREVEETTQRPTLLGAIVNV